MGGAVLALALVAILTLLVLAPVALLHRDTGALEAAYGDSAVSMVSLALGRGGGALASADAAAGRSVYLANCAQCHGGAGDGHGLLGLTTTPPATDLTSPRARQKADAQLLWVVRNGLGFTGMPAYGSQLSETDLANVVAYVRVLERSAS
ncbi:MAG: cytochrome c [Chloroflexi bacterium]|nr:cytochrome c [Chloroflexota bacterium]